LAPKSSRARRTGHLHNPTLHWTLPQRRDFRRESLTCPERWASNGNDEFYQGDGINRDGLAQINRGYAMTKHSRDAVELDSLEVAGLGTVTAGLRVSHPSFGPGTVKSIFQWPPPCQSQHSIVVSFERIGDKMLVPEYAKLTRIMA
jgi:hypothetical protein